MHRESGVHTHRAWTWFVPTALMALATGCGSAGGEETPAGGEGTGSSPVASTPSEPPSTPLQPEAGEPPRVQPWFHRLGGPQDDTGTGLAVDGRGDIAMVWLSTPREDED